jgi:hypothetical protein
MNDVTMADARRALQSKEIGRAWSVEYIAACPFGANFGSEGHAGRAMNRGTTDGFLVLYRCTLAGIWLVSRQFRRQLSACRWMTAK